MLGCGRGPVGQVRALRAAERRFRLRSTSPLGLALLGGALLAVGCGGRAEGVAPGEPTSDPDDPVSVPARGGPRRLGGASGATTPSEAPSISPDAVQSFCYVPEALDSTPELEELLPFLPGDAFDGQGCLAGEYSGWLLPGRCVYDPSGAELEDGRCCYRMDSLSPDCP